MYLHWTFKGRRYAMRRLGTAKGACGTARKRLPFLPVAPRGGTWKVYVTAGRKLRRKQALFRIDLNVFRMSELGTGALEDGIFVTEEWIADEANQDVAVRFLKASFKGWVYCRDNPDDCTQYVLDAGPTLGEGHQRWMVNEINKLIWPNDNGIGVMDEEDYATTAQIAQDYGIVKKDPGDGVYTTEYAEAAVQALEDEGVDVKGEGFEAPEVEVTEGGE